MINPKEWEDVTPFQITVVSKGARTNNYGRSDFDPTTTRSYKCYLDMNERVIKNVDGVEVRVSATAYSLGIPVNGTVPVPVQEEDKVTLPDGRVRVIAVVQSHFDQDGTLYAQTIGFQ